MTAIVPWTPGRGVSYEKTLENEVLALRDAVRALHQRGQIDTERLPWMGGCLADEAFARALDGGSGGTA